MSTKINYTTAKSGSEAFLKTKAFMTPEYLEKLQLQVDLSFDESKKIGVATGKGFTLTMKFFDTYCDVDLDLSFLLKPLRSKIMSKIEHQIAKNL